MQWHWLLPYTFLRIAKLNAQQSDQPNSAPHVLFVNMDRSSARRQYTESWLTKCSDVPSTRLAAIDAFHLDRHDPPDALTTHATLYTIGDNRHATMQVRTWRFGLWGSFSTIGCGLSHAKAIVMAYSMGLQEALIIEDDIQMTNLTGDTADNSNMVWHYLRQLVASLPPEWDILQVFNTIYSSRKAYEVHNQLMQQILWTRKNACAGDSHLVMGAGAYLISRKGMHQFISRHLPQFLHATQAEAEAFGGLMNFRGSTVSLVSDMWVYDLNDVYVSTLPLFVPADHVAQYSTIHSNGDGSAVQAVMPTAQQQALQVALYAFKAANVFDMNSTNTILADALTHTRQSDAQSQLFLAQSGTGSSVFAVVLELADFHAQADTKGLETPHCVYDVTAAEQRLQLFLELESSSPDKAKVWRLLLDSYFEHCVVAGRTKLRHEKVPNSGSCISESKQLVHVLVPVYFKLRAFSLPLDADSVAVASTAKQICLSNDQDTAQCASAMMQRVELAIQLYAS
jgi:GR25 family glycosyltransferase involved in LPS biosynthesis